VAKIEEATSGTLAFLANPKYNKYLYTTEASIVLINKDFELEQKVSLTLIKVDNAYESFAKLLELAEQARPVKQGISELAFIEE
ncbi:MAG: UDP-3-O-(3-hydroxymyristoyl)glucosamine N-acyltransferase, partial [Marinilabiliales bacterium]